MPTASLFFKYTLCSVRCGVRVAEKEQGEFCHRRPKGSKIDARKADTGGEILAVLRRWLLAPSPPANHLGAM